MLSSAKNNTTGYNTWWLNMKRSDFDHVNRIAEEVKDRQIALRIISGECHRAASLHENKGKIDTRFVLEGRKTLLEKFGMYQGSDGRLTDKEEYYGQLNAYRSCSTIHDYIGNLEQVKLLEILRYGFMKRYLTFPVEDEGKGEFEGDATCFDFSINEVKPFLSADMQVFLDVEISANIFYFLVSDDLNGEPSDKDDKHDKDDKPESSNGYEELPQCEA